MEQRKFLAMVGPLAQADMQKSGILASLTIAQAILESGWGASELATKANALFGIKADARWSGKAYSKDTKECYDGATYTTITALFRAYDSWAGQNRIQPGHCRGEIPSPPAGKGAGLENRQ